MPQRASPSRGSGAVSPSAAHYDGIPPISLYNHIAKAIGHKLHMTGGVSHPVGHSPGFQFTQFGFQEGAIVAARLEFGVRVASGLARSCLRGRGVYATRCNPSDDPHI